MSALEEIIRRDATTWTPLETLIWLAHMDGGFLAASAADELAAQAAALDAAREGWEILATADTVDGWILVAPQFVTKYRKALAALRGQEAGG